MVTLPELADYTAAEVAAVAEASPAFTRYQRLLGEGNLPAHVADRHRAWCRAVAATIHERAPAAAVCASWSHAADRILRALWIQSGFDEIPALLLGFGKLGAGELNLSSDVDLLVLAERAALPAAHQCLRRLRGFLAPNDFGVCLRPDFDLRPGGRDGPLIATVDQFREHYWKLGEPWERLAMVRLRPLAGRPDLRARIADLIIRFAYRRHLDYTLNEDLREIRAAVHSRGFTRQPGSINLKLEVGGIRDVELFTHLNQVIHGGRHPELRVHSTSRALAELSRLQILEADTARRLDRCYWNLREFENRVQLIEDRQTHDLPEGQFSDQTRAMMTEVDTIVSRLLGQNATVVDLPTTETAQRTWLEGLGFGPVAIASWPRLIAATAQSRRGARDERARLNFLFKIVRAIARQPNADQGLCVLADFVRAARGKASLFTLMLHRPGVIEDLARFVTTSRYLAHILVARPELLEQLHQSNEVRWSTETGELLGQLADYKLLNQIWAANKLTNGTPVGEICTRVSDVADQIAGHLLDHLHREFPDTSVEVLALGKWGGRELGLRSDLDFVFITDREPTAEDFKVARRFINRLTDTSGSGALFEVDLRLRPSGQSGPLMVTRAKLRRYWTEVAPVWKRQAYLRARPLRGTFAREGLCAREVSDEDLRELARIRRNLTSRARACDLKFSPGGLVDVEFTAQTALLIRNLSDAPSSTVGMIDRLMTVDAAWRAHGPEIITIYDELRLIEQALQLTADRKLHQFNPEAETARQTAQLLGIIDLADRTRELLERSRTHLNYVDPITMVDT